MTAETVAKNVDNHVPGFSGKQKFKHSSDMSYMTPSATMQTDLQSATDESIDQSQSECDHPLSESISEAGSYDVGGEKMSRRKPARFKRDTIPATTFDEER